jgi:hypothetical protein
MKQRCEQNRPARVIEDPGDQNREADDEREPPQEWDTDAKQAGPCTGVGYTKFVAQGGD